MKRWVGKISIPIVKVLSCLGLVVGMAIGFKISVNALTKPELLIVEIQTASKSSAGEEFVKIANTANKTIDLEGVRLEYFSASPKSITVPSRTINLKGKLTSNKTYLIASKDYLVDKADLGYSPTLAGAGGHLRLSIGAVTNPNVYDFVGWGTAQYPRGSAATAPPAGEVLKRRKDTSGQYLYTGDNSKDFSLGETQPKSIVNPVLPSSKPTPTSVIPNKPASTPNTKQDYSGLRINELLANPAKPVLDSEGEFIELYNSSKRSITLTGLKVLSGSKLNNSYSFKSGSLAAGQYLALYITESKLTLANNGGRVALRTSDGRSVGPTVVYGKAKDGLAYAYNGSAWVWTSSPTPGRANSIAGGSSSGSGENGEVLGSVDSVGGDGTSEEIKDKKKQLEQSPSRPVNSGIIAGVGGLGLLYGIYEYRTDIGNLFSKLRRNDGHRQKDRRKT